MRISAQVDFGIVRLTKRKDNSKLGDSKFDSPKCCPDALHRIAFIALIGVQTVAVALYLPAKSVRNKRICHYDTDWNVIGLFG